MAFPRLSKETSIFRRSQTIATKFDVLKDSIDSVVAGTETYTDADGIEHTSPIGSWIKQTSEGLTSFVQKNQIISTINQSAEQVQIAANKLAIDAAAIFRSLVIGGRNLLRRSQVWNTQYATTSFASDSGWGYTLPQSTSDVAAITGNFDADTLELGVEYTLSFVAWADGATQLNYEIYPDTYTGIFDSATVNVTAEKQRYTLTGELINSTGEVVDGTRLRFRRSRMKPNYAIYITDIKLERANVASAWTCAPEDTDADIQAAQSAANGAEARVQEIFIQATLNTSSVAAVTTWVTKSDECVSDDDSALTPHWSTKRPTYRRKFPVTFRALQSQTVEQHAAGSTCGCTTPTKDDTSTIIDGGHIITGTVNANALVANCLALGNLTAEAQGIINGKASASDLQAEVSARRAQLGTCSAEVNVTNPVAIVTCAGFVRTEGVEITVAFAARGIVYNDTAVRLNVNDTGAADVWVAGAVTSASNNLRWGAGARIRFRWVTDHYEVVGEPRVWYGESTTAADTQMKTDTTAVTGVVICRGTTVNMRMTNANTVMTPKLSVQNTGSISIYTEGSTISATSALAWSANSTIPFVFNGTAWEYDSNGSRKATTAYTRANDAVSTASSALELATNAGKTATDYLTFLENVGLDVGYSGSYAKTRISTDGVEVYDGDGTSMLYAGIDGNESVVRVGGISGHNTHVSPSALSIRRGKVRLFEVSTNSVSSTFRVVEIFYTNGGGTYWLSYAPSSIASVMFWSNDNTWSSSKKWADYSNYTLPSSAYSLSDAVNDDTTITGKRKSITVTPPSGNALNQGYLTIAYDVVLSNTPSLKSGIGTASNTYGVALGFSCKASGGSSVAIGMGCIAGYGSAGSQSLGKSVAIGRLAISEAGYAIGTNVQTDGDGAVALGKITKAFGEGAFAAGYGAICSTGKSVAIGTGVFALYQGQTVLGKYNASTTSTGGFVVGNGSSDSNRSNCLELTNGGNLWIAGSLTQNSDRRLKEHVAYLGDDAVNFVRALMPALFIKDGGRHLGFYAQDVADAEPDDWDTETVAAQHMDDSLGFDPLTLDYTALIAPLVAYVQALERRVEQMEARIKELEDA